ncbi:MAG: hypothetical protein ACTSVM_05255 [Candidatus Ranarchaeia archaeon]
MADPETLSNNNLIKNHVCTGCALLCDDVWLDRDAASSTVHHTYHACIRGHRHLLRLGSPRRLKTPVMTHNGTHVSWSWDKAIQKTKKIIEKSRHPLIYGLGSASNEAIEKAFMLADQIGASVIGSPENSYIYLLEEFITRWNKHILPFKTISDEAELILFWGSNPAETHPRYMSKYTVFPRGAKTPNGRESRTIATFDIRKSPTAQISNLHFLLKPELDAQYMQALTRRILSKGGKKEDAGIADTDRASLTSLSKAILQSSLVLLCIGGGVFSHDYFSSNLEALEELLSALEKKSIRWAIHPMVSHPNTYGYIKIKHDQTNVNGISSRASFEDSYDAVLVLGADPLAHLPGHYHQLFRAADMIVLEPEFSLTSKYAKIHLPTQSAGMETGGTMLRLDRKKISLTPAITMNETRLSDLQVIERLLE